MILDPARFAARLHAVARRSFQAARSERLPEIRALALWLDCAAGTVYTLLALRMLFLERRTA